jgi:Na+-transporting NADH:ubiquinone oxidoreductase subunit NqrD
VIAPSKPKTYAVKTGKIWVNWVHFSSIFTSHLIDLFEALFRMRCGCWILLAPSFFSTLAYFIFTLNHMFTCAAMEIRKILSKHTTFVGRAIESLIKVGRANSQSMLDLPQVCLL